MKNLLQKNLEAKLAKKQKIFCAFLTLGYPNLAATEKLVEQFEKAGADIIELGFPFSDPMADGPTIQYSSEQALKHGVKVKDAFNLVTRLRKRGVKVPIIFFTYLNPIFHYGLKRFVQDAKRSGFDGVLVPDLPPNEESGFEADCRKAGLANIFLVAPTSQADRVKMIARHSEGFIYYVSLRGVTGARKALASDIKASIAQLKKVTTKPVLIGFGVSTPEQAKNLSRQSQGVIVGSAIVDVLRKSNGRIEPAIAFVKKMVKAVKG